MDWYFAPVAEFEHVLYWEDRDKHERMSLRTSSGTFAPYDVGGFTYVNVILVMESQVSLTVCAQDARAIDRTNRAMPIRMVAG